MNLNFRVEKLLRLGRVTAISLIAGLLFIGMTSCEEDDTCTTTAYKYPVASKTVNKDGEITYIQSPLTADVYVDGDAQVTGQAGGLNTNGYNMVITGNLTINGGYNGNSNTTVHVGGMIMINGGTNLNQSVILCDSVWINGGMNGQGTIYYCTSQTVNGNVNQNQNEPIVINDCDAVTGHLLTDGAVNYEIVTVPCDMIGVTQGGFYYANAPASANYGKVAAIRTCCESTEGAAHTSSCIYDDAPDSGQE